jgi:hypothetical protein
MFKKENVKSGMLVYIKTLSCIVDEAYWYLVIDDAMFSMEAHHYTTYFKMEDWDYLMQHNYILKIGTYKDNISGLTRYINRSKGINMQPMYCNPDVDKMTELWIIDEKITSTKFDKVDIRQDYILSNTPNSDYIQVKKIFKLLKIKIREIIVDNNKILRLKVGESDNPIDSRIEGCKNITCDFKFDKYDRFDVVKIDE